MKIGLLGTGNIGKTLARKLAAASHNVKVANSRGPDSIAADVLVASRHQAHMHDGRGVVLHVFELELQLGHDRFAQLLSGSR